MVVGLHCHRRQQKVEWLLEEFSVLETLSNMTTKKEIKGPNGFECFFYIVDDVILIRVFIACFIDVCH
jgi:hypothetical protein